MSDPGGMPMEPMSPWALARPMALAGSVLALSYGVVVLSDLAPLRLLDPAWLSRFCRTLSGWAFLPLIGTVLVHVAAMLDPDDEGLQRRQRRFRRAGVAACLGLLLLIPVEAMAVLRAVELSSIRASEARQSAQLRFTRLRQITMAASSTNALVEGLVALQGPVLPSAALQMPLAQLGTPEKENCASSSAAKDQGGQAARKLGHAATGDLAVSSRQMFLRTTQEEPGHCQE